MTINFEAYGAISLHFRLFFVVTKTLDIVTKEIFYLINIKIAKLKALQNLKLNKFLMKQKPNRPQISKLTNATSYTYDNAI